MRFGIVMMMAGWAAAQPPVALDATKPLRVLSLQGQTYHVQGIDTDGVHLWVTSVDTPDKKGYLHEFSISEGRLERSVEVQIGAQFHPGGIATDATSIWIPVAEYRAKSTAVIQKRNKKTLELEFQFEVPDHVGCVAVTPEFVIGGNWDSKEFYFWDHAGKLIRKVASATGNAYQDLKVDGGRLVGSGTLPGRQGAIDWLDMTTLQLLRRTTVPETDKGAPLTREGMTIFGDQLWLLPEDGPSRLFVFSITK